MKYVYIILISFSLMGCIEPSFHEKTLKEINDLKNMGDELEMERNQLIKENQRVLDFKFRE